MSHLTVVDLVPVIYSAGTVFDRLQVGRQATESFLRSGDLSGILSRADLSLLEDLRDAAQYVLDHAGEPVNAQIVSNLNAVMTRSASTRPGELRGDDQEIGVATPYGVYAPRAITAEEIDSLVTSALSRGDPLNSALDLFVGIAKAQPFMDGNKRTALFVANAELIASGGGRLLTIPVDDEDSSVAAEFTDRLARAYVFGEDEGVRRLLAEQGAMPSL